MWCQLFRLGSVLGSCFRVKNLPSFLHWCVFRSQEPSSVQFSFFIRSQESSLVFPQYPRFLSILVDIPWFCQFFASFFLETLMVYFQVFFRSQEPSSVLLSVFSSCQEPFFGLCHGLFQRVQILTLQFHYRSIPPSYNSWSTLLWYRCYYLHRSRDLCGVFCLFKLHIGLLLATFFCYSRHIITPGSVL